MLQIWLSLFKSEELKDLSFKVEKATNTFIEEITTNTSTWQNSETKARIMEEKKYEQNIALLVNNKEIIDPLKRYLIPLPAPYRATEKHCVSRKTILKNYNIIKKQNYY
jgi:hypothetical protein